MKYVLILFFIIYPLFSISQSIEDSITDDLFAEFKRFEKEMYAFPRCDTTFKDLDLFLYDFRPVWMSDLPQRNYSNFGLIKMNDGDSIAKFWAKSLNSRFHLASVVLYGSNYVVVDVWDPPQGSIQDVIYYFERKYVHQIDDLKKDTIYSSQFKTNEPILIEDTNHVSIIPEFINEVEYSKFNKTTNHDSTYWNLPHPIKRLDSSITFKLMYMVKEVTVSGPLSGSSKTICKGEDDKYIRAYNLELNDLVHSGMGFGMIGAILYKRGDDYVYKLTSEYIGNTSSFYSRTYYLEKVE